MLNNKEGIVLVTGPTGSGKTTTLYSALRMVQSEGVNIVTVEDPVEYRLGKGIVQVQVHEKAGLTFAAALRSILRQDPDVVLVGEVRDRETAQIALQASLTGHLVLSTLHTNDAPNAITRLVDMGMEPYKIGPALRGRDRRSGSCGGSAPAAARSATADIPTRIRRYIPTGHDALPRGRLPRLRHDRIPRPILGGGNPDHEHRAGAEDRGGRYRGQDRRSRQGERDEIAVRERPAACAEWGDQRRGAAPRGGRADG